MLPFERDHMNISTSAVNKPLFFILKKKKVCYCILIDTEKSFSYDLCIYILIVVYFYLCSSSIVVNILSFQEKQIQTCQMFKLYFLIHILFIQYVCHFHPVVAICILEQKLQMMNCSWISYCGLMQSHCITKSKLEQFFDPVAR